MVADDEKRRTEDKDEAARARREGTPAAGPHAEPELTNEDATPGAGSLPERTDGEADPASG